MLSRSSSAPFFYNWIIFETITLSTLYRINATIWTLWTPIRNTRKGKGCIFAAEGGFLLVIKFILVLGVDVDLTLKTKKGDDFGTWREKTAREQAKAMGYDVIQDLLASFEPSGDFMETSQRQNQIKFNLQKELELSGILFFSFFLSFFSLFLHFLKFIFFLFFTSM